MHRWRSRLRDGFPLGKRFAFTILDDTDDATVENVKPVYDLLYELGYRTTKTVWPVDCPEGSREYFAGHTLSNPGYLHFCLELRARGFEITWHGATMESSTRDRTIKGLERFRDAFGHYPALHVNHAQNRENIYWGRDRYQTGAIRFFAGLHKGDERYVGHVEGSPYFWGDLCLEHFRFTRNFTFYDINTLKADPHTPYRLDATPFVRRWFSTSDGTNVDEFARVVHRGSIDRLHREGGVCILSTHLAKGFVTDGRVDLRVADALRYMSTLPGWFVPVSEVLDYLMMTAPTESLSRPALARLELRHAVDRFRGVR